MRSAETEMKKHLARCLRKLDKAKASKLEADALYNLRAADVHVLLTELFARAYSPTGGVTIVGCRFTAYWAEQ